jgi:hypothetical protein
MMSSVFLTCHAYKAENIPSTEVKKSSKEIKPQAKVHDKGKLNKKVVFNHIKTNSCG